MQAAAEEKAPIFLQTFDDDLHCSGYAEVAAAARAVICGTPVPILRHLDHPDGMPRLVRCLQMGYCSLMFDGVALPSDENIAATPRAMEVAHAWKAMVGAELGQLGGEHQGGSVVGCTRNDGERKVRKPGWTCS